jgi:hypothetical protein
MNKQLSNHRSAPAAIGEREKQGLIEQPKTFSAKAALFVFSMCIAMPSMSYDEAYARQNFAAELTECAAYYAIWAEAAGREARLGTQQCGAISCTQSAEDNQFKSDLLRKAALRLTEEKKFLALLELAMKSQTDIVNNEGFARLILKHRDVCTTALEHPEQRMQYWRGRK